MGHDYETNDDTRTGLIESIQRLADGLGRSPTVQDLKSASGYPPLNRFLTVFGSWNAAKQAAGLETYRKEGHGEPYSDDELLDRLQDLARNTEGPVTMQDVADDPDCPSAVTYQRRFGSWNKAKEAAGLETIEADETSVKYTDDELCEMLRTLAATVDGPLSVRDVEAADEYPDHTTFERRFGSWNKAKHAAGLDPIQKGAGRRGETYSDAELLAQLRACAAEIEGPVTETAINRTDGYPAASTYIRRFGSWQTAKHKAGLDQERTPGGQQYTDEQLLESLRELADPLDRPLTRTDVAHAEEAPSVSTFEYRFGSWNRAKQAAGLETLNPGEHSH